MTELSHSAVFAARETASVHAPADAIKQLAGNAPSTCATGGLRSTPMASVSSSSIKVLALTVDRVGGLRHRGVLIVRPRFDFTVGR
jgi:hypothetical protein